MDNHNPNKASGSLLERANDMFDFASALRGIPQQAPVAQPVKQAPVADAATFASAPVAPVHVSPPAPAARLNRRKVHIDRAALVVKNFIDPDGAVTALSEEFRIVKRQLLLSARGGKGVEALHHGARILVCSALPNEGKTYCAINLALSMATEKDNRVLLVDADFAKPSVLRTFGLDDSPGLMDALSDNSVDAEDFVIETDIDGLSILPAGRQTNQDTEYLAAARTAQIIDQLTRNDPQRIVIFDSPPALAASPASVLAMHVGQILMIVHADETNESSLREALNLLSGCEHVQLLLNWTKFSPTGRKFGHYYGYGA